MKKQSWNCPMIILQSKKQLIYWSELVIEILPKLGSAIVRKVINIETSLAVTESKNFCNCLNSSMNFCEYPSWSSRIFSLMEAVEFGKLVNSGYQIVKLWSYKGEKTQLIEEKKIKFHEICFEYFQWHYFTKFIPSHLYPVIKSWAHWVWRAYLNMSVHYL